MIVLQDKIQERLDALDRTKEGDEQKFKKHDVPWNTKMLTEVKHASLVMLDQYMRIALAEAREIMGSSLRADTKREKALAMLRGTEVCLIPQWCCC